MTIPDNRPYLYRTDLNYSSCSWYGLMAGPISLVTEDGESIATHGVLVHPNSQAAFARAQLLALYRARGYMTEEEMIEHQIKPDPAEWDIDYTGGSTIWRARAHDAPSRKSN